MEEKQEIEIVDDGGPAIPVLHPDSRKPWVYDTSLPRRTQEDMAVVAAVLEAEEVDKTGHVGDEFQLSHWLAHPVVYTSRSTGELVSALRLVYVLSDGRVLGGSGKPMVESLERLTAMARRPPPWDPPITVRLIQRSAGEDGRTFKLQYVRG